MVVDRQKLREQIHALYRAEHNAMGERGTLDRLDRARSWDLAPTLRASGVFVFPHAGVVDCGHQNLAGGKPERLPGMDELARLAENAVIVSTADPFHHGVGYGDPPERALHPDQGGLELARSDIHRYRRTVPAAQANMGCRSVDRMEGSVRRAHQTSLRHGHFGCWCTIIKGIAFSLEIESKKGREFHNGREPAH